MSTDVPGLITMRFWVREDSLRVNEVNLRLLKISILLLRKREAREDTIMEPADGIDPNDRTSDLHAGPHERDLRHFPSLLLRYLFNP